MSPLVPPFSTLPPEGPAPELDRPSQPLRQTLRHLLFIAAGLALWILFASTLRPKLKEAINQPPLPSTQNAMKQIGLVFKMYAIESAGNHWPGLADNERIWAPELSVLYPEYLSTPNILVAYEHPDAEHIRASLRAVLEGPNPDYETAEGLMALSFAYLGCAFYDEEGFGTVVKARTSGWIDGSGEFVKLPDSGEMVYPFREGIERFLITDVNGPWAVPPGLISSIPVLVETWQWKSKAEGQEFRDCYVLYLDGHVKRVPLGTFPVVPSVMDALCGLDP